MFDAKMTRRTFAATMGAGALAALAGCGGSEVASEDETIKVGMVTDTGGINDESFNQLAWAGLQKLQSDFGYEISYIESKQDSDYKTNLDKLIDDGTSVIWGIGFAMADAISEVADQNPDVMFGSVEGSNELGVDNLTTVAFKSQEPSFVEGYIAARMSKAGKVGFIGGQKGPIIESFEYGYYAGVEYANAEQGTSVTYQGQYAESFTDAAKGKSIAQKMIKDGCDVMFHAAGGCGIGMLEACNDAKVYSIGVDQDQAAKFPEYDTIISSALKMVDVAVFDITSGLLDGSMTGGTDEIFGAAEDGVGIAPTHDKLPDDIYEAALELLEKFKAGDIVVPATKDELDAFKASL